MRAPTTRFTTTLLAGILFAASSGMAAPPVPKYRPGTVLIGFSATTPENVKSFWYAQVGGSEQRRMGQGVHMLSVPPGLETAVIQFLKASGAAKYAELDYQHTATAGAIPNDSSFSNQWGLLNTGQTVNGYAGPAGADVRATPAWSVATGTNSVVVAVLDTGVQYTHPDLFTNMWSNPGGINGCAAGTHGYNVLAASCDPMDDETWYGGHGTHVAGVIGATGNNGAGITGANWTTSILPVKWIASNATGYTSDLISAMDWVIHAKQAGVNIKVANDSATWPGDAFSQALSDEIDALGANDILFVSASGNGSSNIDSTPVYPCSYMRPTQLCVAALDMDLSLWVASNWGATSVHMGAPGAAIYSTLRQSNYGIISGASMSAALVAGAAALALSNGDMPVATLKSTLLNAVTQQSSLVGRTVTGGSLNLCKLFPSCGGAAATPTILSAPVVTGVPAFGSRVGASTGRWAGQPANFAYQWLRCDSQGLNCQAIAGATSQAYGIFGAMDAGGTLAVSVTASNSIGATTVTSPASSVVASVVPPFTINSTIAGGAVLTGSVTWQASSSQPMNFVEFYIDGVLSQTATSAPYTYNGSSNSLFDTTKLSPGTHTLGLHGLSSDNRTYSYNAATVTVGAGPVNTVLPAISGTPAVGNTLQVSNGTWNGSPTGYSYQWLRCDASGNNCGSLSGATASSYVVVTADAGLTLRCTVTASNAGGSTPARSAAVLIPGTAHIALVQSKSAEGSSVKTVSVTFGTSNNSGNLIVAFVRISSSNQTVSLSDTLGNTYATAVSQVQAADGHQSFIFYAKNVRAGSNTVKATFSATNNHPFVAVYEFSGLSTTSPLDQTASSQANDSASVTSPSRTTATANELLFSGVGFPYAWGGNVTAGSGYAINQQDTATSRSATEFRIVSTAGAYSGVFTLDSLANWSTVFATFR